MIFRKKITGLLLFVFLGLYCAGQTQVVRGKVFDQETRGGLPGANIVLISDTSGFVATTTDSEGYFVLEEVPLGRQAVRVSYVGYEPKVISGLVVNVAKEVVLNVGLEESMVKIKEVEVSTERERESLNEMALISAKTFSVDETDRYAGSRGDPARMASNYAGVQGNNDSSNDIIVRGNSPLGVLWRLENVNIPNPNHFGVSGTSGGPVSILNNKTLSNSSFFTGAFPAGYGNTVAAAFDLNMRSGNPQHHEVSGQLGFLGTELMAEGPLSKKQRASYLVTYRYSTLAIFHALGINIGTDAVPKYQDGAFKLNFPNKKGSFSVFGIGGMSRIDIIKSDQEEPDEEAIYGNEGVDEHFKTGMGVMGANWVRQMGKKAYLKVTLSASSEHQENFIEKIHRQVVDAQYVVDSLTPQIVYDLNQNKYGLSGYLNKKVNARNTFRAGWFADVYQLDLHDSIYNEQLNEFQVRLDHRGKMLLLQPYVQWKFKINEKLTLSSGVHSQWLTLNSQLVVEPRISAEWQIDQDKALKAGLGLHSQMAPTYVYFIQEKNEEGNDVQINKDLGFLRSRHAVLGYRQQFQKWAYSTEVYYQNLYNVPVTVAPSSYSVLNEGDELNRFFPDSLDNEGTGRNYGVELTAQRYFSGSWFLLLSSSLFDSKYTASDGNQYNTAFNGNYVLNLLGTKEFYWGKMRPSTLGIGGKITLAGGRRYTPIDVAASELKGYAVYIDEQRNAKQFRDYFRADIKLNYKLNATKVTHEVGLDLVNFLGIKNILKQTYTGGDPPVIEQYQLGFLPIFYYKVDF